jgi:hypothetical protein
MILRNDFHVNKKDLQIIVTSPVLSSLQQPIWKDLKRRRYDIVGIHLDKKAMDVIPKNKKKKLLIIDDVDHVTEIKKGREWLLDLFGTESHHSDITIVLIAHHLKIGCPAIRSSADAVILCSLPIPQLKQTMKDLCLESDEEEKVINTLSDPIGAPDSSEKKYIQLFNHAVVWRKPLFIIKSYMDNGAEKKESVRGPSIYTFPRKITDKPVMTPI